MLSSLIYESVFKSGPTGNYLLAPTPEATILAVNDAFLNASSRKPEDLVGLSLFVAFPSNPDDPHDTGEAALRDSIRLAIETGKTQVMPVQRYPISVVLPDGSEGYTERFWSAVNTPIFDGNGKLLCISHTTTDITDKVHADAAQRESETRLRALITATADVIYRMSADWTHMHPLDGRGFLTNTDSTAPYVLDNYVPPEDQEIVRRTLDQAIHSKTIFALEHRVRRADGSIGWTYSKAIPMLDDNGNIYEWIGAASDITQRKLAEEKLKESDRRKDEFLAMLAHELRNPLAPISAAAELLQMVKLDEVRVRQTSQIIGRQVQHMTGLVDDLLDVSRVTRGLVELDTASIDINHIITDAIEQATPLIRTRQHHLGMRLAADATLILGDKKRLVQVVANLLSNAAKYTPEGGHILIRTEVRPTDVLIQVSDDGIGMAPGVVARAFDLFAQAERTSDRSSGGLGLGLALVKSLVEHHHGTVTCESPGLGRGSTFIICLPRLLADGSAKEPQEALLTSQQNSKTLRIMVVDDNMDAATMLAMLLEAAGHKVLVEHRVHRALERAKVDPPQVFLLDIGLPEMDGNELAKRLRAQPETANAVLIAITGYGQDGDRGRALAAGFDHHLVKPVDTAKLAAILAEAT